MKQDMINALTPINNFILENLSRAEIHGMNWSTAENSGSEFHTVAEP